MPATKQRVTIGFNDESIKGPGPQHDRDVDPFAPIRRRWVRDETVLIFDASVMCYRAYHTRDLSAPSGEGTSVLHGVLQMIRSTCDAANTRRWLLVWDGGVAYKRADHPGYKIRHDRQRTPEEQLQHDDMKRQIRLARSALDSLGAPSLMHPDLEADDLIGIAAGMMEKAIASGINPTMRNVCVVTDDKDAYQLISPITTVFRGAAGKHVDLAAFREQFNFDPEHYVDYKALVGESKSGDNIPGVRGIGDVNAAKLVALHAKPDPKVATTPLSAIIFTALDAAQKPKCLKTYQAIATQRNNAYLSFKLSRIARTPADLLGWKSLPRDIDATVRASTFAALKLACKKQKPCSAAAVRKLRTELGFASTFDRVMWETVCGFDVR